MYLKIKHNFAIMQVIEPDKLFNVKSEEEFNNLALEVFNSQYRHNKLYNGFVSQFSIKTEKINHYSQIPFLPIEFFKTHEVICGERKKSEIIFTSSSTSSQIPSRHIVKDISIYEKSFLKGFEYFYGNPADYVIIALLPNYLERGQSSLVFMFNKLIELSKKSESGFYTNDYSKLKNVVTELKNRNQKTILIGVTYALLDLAEQNIELSDNFIVMETGGMKGRREELLKEELDHLLKEKLGVNTIHSEYGMTELLSQAYSKGSGEFKCVPWMKIVIRDIEDPLSWAKQNKTGGINIIDLANINSCSFIATHDLGRINANGKFELMGRFDNTDIRGCNLMVE